MKKLIILALFAVIMTGCTSKYSPLLVPIYGYNETVIDSCEYIYSSNTMAHKGNCKYCAARRKAELRELVKQLKEK